MDAKYREQNLPRRKHSRSFLMNESDSIPCILTHLIFFFFFLWDWGLKSRIGTALAKQVLYCLSHTSSPFWSGYFENGVPRTICPG
jgi:hypothetical protein